MADHRNTDARARHQTSDLRDSAPQASSAVVGHNTQRDLDPAIINKLYTAALGADRAKCRDALASVLACGTRRTDLADLYVPAVAHKMGDHWCSDQLGFAEVTIGVSRLQAMLRDLGPDWSGDKAGDADAGSILLIVPQEVYHTLGAMVLAGQLRRRGLTVRLMLGAQARDVDDQLRQSYYNAVFISAARGDSLERLRKIVDVARAATNRPMPIVIGGSLLDVLEAKEMIRMTGADHATAQPKDALELCGLHIARPSNVSSIFRA